MPSPHFPSPVGTSTPRTLAVLAAARDVIPAKNSTYQGAPCGLKGCTATTRVFIRPVTDEKGHEGWWHARCAVCWGAFYWRPETAPSDSREA